MAAMLIYVDWWADMMKAIGTFHDHTNTPKKTYPGLKVSENHFTIPFCCNVLRDNMTICMLIHYSSPWDLKGEEQEPFCQCFEGTIRRLAWQISHCWIGSTTTLFIGLKSNCVGRAPPLQQHFALFIQTLNFISCPRKQHITLAAIQLGNHHNIKQLHFTQ